VTAAPHIFWGLFIELSQMLAVEDVADAAHRSAFPEIKQSADRTRRTGFAAGSARDCERSVHGDGRTHSDVADHEALRLRRWG
jgi:hypothetical protein